MKGGKDQVVKQELDPATQAYQQQVYGRALGASNQGYTPYQGQTTAGVSPLTEGAAGQFQDVSKLAGQGAAAMGGDQAAFQKFMNPYQSNVLDQMITGFDKQRMGARTDADELATRQGAFGGSRAAIESGVRQGAIDTAQGNAMANLQYQGFNDAQGRAATAANLGMGAATQAFGAGDYYRNVQQQGMDANHQGFNEARDWDLRNLQTLQGGMQGTPYGTQQTTPTERNAMTGMAGGAMNGAAIGGVPGAVIGGGLGLLFG